MKGHTKTGAAVGPSIDRTWRRFGLLGAVLLLAPTWSAARSIRPAASDLESVGRIDVLVVDFAKVSPGIFEVMAQEAGALLSPTGLQLEWKRVAASATSRNGETRLVLLPDGARGGLAGRAVLGSSHADRAGPTLWLFQPTVLAEIGVREEDLPALGAVGQRRVGQALGRVVAHEMIHALLPGWPHSRHGLMAHETTGSWLLRRHVQLDPQTLDALRLVAGSF